MAGLRASTIFRPFSAIRFFPRSQSLVFQQQRFYPGQDYGGGQGDPKGEKPQEQGSNPSAEKEHPGPPPPDVGKGTGGGPTKAHEGGHNTQENASSSGSSKQSGASQSSNGPQPKIYAENPPTEENDDVKAHNEDMAKRHDRANAEVDSKGETVEKGFWKVLSLHSDLARRVNLTDPCLGIWRCRSQSINLVNEADTFHGQHFHSGAAQVITR
ncbi:MAG: hypothetical protein Q9218_002217 [Villophora microphyllina]